MPDEMDNTRQHADVVYPTTRQSMRLLMKELFGDDERSGFSPISVRGEDSLFVEQDETQDDHTVPGRQKHKAEEAGNSTSALAATEARQLSSPGRIKSSPAKKGAARKVKPPRMKKYDYVDVYEDDDDDGPLSRKGCADGLDFLSTEDEYSDDCDDNTFKFVQQGPDKPTAAERISNDAIGVPRIRNDPAIFSQGDRVTCNPKTRRLPRRPSCQTPAGRDEDESIRGGDLGTGHTSTQSQELALMTAVGNSITLGSPASSPIKQKPKPQHPLSRPRAALQNVRKGILSHVPATPSSSPDKQKRKVGEQDAVNTPFTSTKRTRHNHVDGTNEATRFTPKQTRKGTSLYGDVEGLISPQVKAQGRIFKDPVFDLRASAWKGFDAPFILKGTFEPDSVGPAKKDSVLSLSADQHAPGQFLAAGHGVLMEDKGQITDEVARPERAFAANCGLDVLAYAAGTVHEVIKDTPTHHNTQPATLCESYLSLRGGADVFAPVNLRASNSTSAKTQTRVHTTSISPLETTVQACIAHWLTALSQYPTGTLDLEAIAIRAMVQCFAEGMLREWFTSDAATMEEVEVMSDDYRLKWIEDQATTIHELEKFVLEQSELRSNVSSDSSQGVPKTMNSRERNVARFERALQKLTSVVKVPPPALAQALESESNVEKLTSVVRTPLPVVRTPLPAVAQTSGSKNNAEKLTSVVETSPLALAQASESEINAERLHQEHERMGARLLRWSGRGPLPKRKVQHIPTVRLLRDARAGRVILTKELMEDQIRQMRDFELLGTPER